MHTPPISFELRAPPRGLFGPRWLYAATGLGRMPQLSSVALGRRWGQAVLLGTDHLCSFLVILYGQKFVMAAVLFHILLILYVLLLLLFRSPPRGGEDCAPLRKEENNAPECPKFSRRRTETGRVQDLMQPRQYPEQYQQKQLQHAAYNYDHKRS